MNIADKTLAGLIYKKTRYMLKDYCELRGIAGSLGGLRSGYVSRANAKILDADGIEWRSASNLTIAGGSCGARIMPNKIIVQQ